MKYLRPYLLLFVVSILNMSCTSDEDFDTATRVIPKIPTIVDPSYPYSFTGSEKFMSLYGSSDAQGGTCFGDYFFQGYNTNSAISVYDLKKKSFICDMPVPAPKGNSRYHVNTINFGNQFVDSNDRFPVLYVCSGYTKDTSSSEAYIFVYRIIENEQNVFQLQLIQTITLQGFGENIWTEGILDNDHDALWIKSNACIYRKYQVPSITEKEVVITPYENVVYEINVGDQPFTSHNQGHIFYDDRIMLVTGIPSRGEVIAFIVINTLTGERENIVYLYDIGLVNDSNSFSNSFEPESVIIYEGDFMVCYRNAIYKLLKQ